MTTSDTYICLSIRYILTLVFFAPATAWPQELTPPGAASVSVARSHETRYSPYWCPRPEELEVLSQHAALTMRGCCIEKAEIFGGDAHNAALKRWKWREYTGSADHCLGTVLPAEDAQRVEVEGIAQQEKIDRDQAEAAVRRTAEEAAKRAEEAAARADRERWLRKPDVRIGMSQQQVLASRWGAPVDIRRSITASHTREQWIYSQQRYLYFDNGRLDAIQE